HHLRDVAWIVLKVAVRGDDEPAPGVGKAGREGCRLTEIAPEPDDPDTGIRPLQASEQPEPLASAAVVDGDDLVWPPQLIKRGRELPVEIRYAGRLVAHRHYYRDLWSHRKWLIIQQYPRGPRSAVRRPRSGA